MVDIKNIDQSELNIVQTFKDYYERNRELKNNLWDNTEVFSDLPEDYQRIVKFVVNLRQVSSENLRNIFRYKLSDSAYSTVMKKLVADHWLSRETKGMGIYYTKGSKVQSCMQLNTKKIFYTDRKISEYDLYKTKLIGAIVDQKVDEEVTNRVISMFMSESEKFRNEYIYTQYIKNFAYNDFLNKETETQKSELLNLGFTQEEIHKFFNFSVKKQAELNEFKKSVALRGFRIEQYIIKYKEKYGESLNNLEYNYFYDTFHCILFQKSSEAMYLLKDYNMENSKGPSDKKLVSMFLNEPVEKQNNLILFFYLKNYLYPEFLNKNPDDKKKDCIKYGFKRQEMKDFIESKDGKTRIKIFYKVLQRYLKNNSEEQKFYLMKRTMYKKLRRRKNYDIPEFIEFYRKEKNFPAEIDIINFLKSADFNYLNYSNPNIRNIIESILLKNKTNERKLNGDEKISDGKYEKFKKKEEIIPYVEKFENNEETLLKDVLKLEYYMDKFESLCGFMRGYAHLRNSLLGTQTSQELLALRVENIEKLTQYHNELVDQINELFDKLAISTKMTTKEEDEKKAQELTDDIEEEIEDVESLRVSKKKIKRVENMRAITFDILKDNCVFVDKIVEVKRNQETSDPESEADIMDSLKSQSSLFEIHLGILDNAEEGIKPSLIFKRIFLANGFLRQVIPNAHLYSIHYTIYTCGRYQNDTGAERAEFIKRRLVYVLDRMKNFTNGEFDNVSKNIDVINLSESKNYIHSKFYNNLREQIRKQINE